MSVAIAGAFRIIFPAEWLPEKRHPLGATLEWGCVLEKRRRCLACGEVFGPSPRVKDRKYCSKPACQRERKRRWQRQKIADDPDYRDNQKDSQKRWREAHRGYWRTYRDSHPQYVQRNRERQRRRNQERRVRFQPIAKMDASRSRSAIVPGAYQLIPLAAGRVAKMDAINVEIRFIPRC